MTLPEIVLAAFGVLASSDEIDRLLPIAEPIADVAIEAPLFRGNAGDAATALALAAIATHESGLRDDVRRCGWRGDHGRSVSAFQLMQGFGWGDYDAAEICGSDAIAARLAHRVLAYHRGRCPRCRVRFLFRAYASGDGGKASDAAADTERVFDRMLRTAGVTVRGAEARWL